MIKCDFLLACLLFICSQTVYAGLQRKLFFDCRDGQQIPSNKKCDAHKDCRDGSDETFVECRRVICPELTCSYVGCYKESQLCDGNIDCWDKTDEHPEYCRQNVTKIPAIENRLQ